MPALSKIAIAQINPTVGDIAGNSAKILQAWRKASDEGAELVVFPELCVTGYPPQDLILSSDFRKKAIEAVQDIAEKTANGAAIIIGCIWEESGKIYNAALLLEGGRIVHIQKKIELPNYGVFDEKRLFAGGNEIIPLTWRGHKIALMVCEDVWHKEIIRSLNNKAIEKVFVINASPFETGKFVKRQELVSEAACSIGADFYYVNMVGGQDDIVFDGGSFAVDKQGKLTDALPQFKESISVIPHLMHDSGIKPVTGRVALDPRFRGDNNWQVWNAMKLGLADYVRKNEFSKVLL